MSATILLTGGTGTIGNKLRHALHEKYGPVRLLSRNPQRARALSHVESAHAWDGKSEVASAALEGIETIIHLAGEPVADKRWNANVKREIRESRVLGTRALVKSFKEMKTPPRTLVSASAVGIYGDRGDELLTETASVGSGFLADVCREWECEATAAEILGARVVCARIGIVLDKEGGALPKMLKPFRLGVGGPLGSGQQWMPWIHVNDVVRLLIHSIFNHSLSGALNVVAPDPSRNADFTHSLGRAVGRPTILRAPAAALKLALGESAAVVLASQRAAPEKAQASGFAFQFSNIDAALADLIGGNK